VIADQYNNSGQHKHLLIYSFKLKSAFDAKRLPLMPVSFSANQRGLTRQKKRGY